MNSEDVLKPEIKSSLIKTKQEEEDEAKTKQMKLVKVKQDEEEKTKQMELARLMQEEEKIKAFASIEKEMVLIPAGKFMMGSPASEKSRSFVEKQHNVNITKPFYLGKYEVTQEQYESVLGNNPSSRTKGSKFPVTDVSWDDCQEFIKKLNANTKGGYRLPSEAEWEYACRAGTTTAYSFGGEFLTKDGNCEESGIGKTVVVGCYKPNAFGLYDMHGNVFEWCEDWFGVYPVGTVTDPKNPANSEDRMLRGGSFIFNSAKARSSYRLSHPPTDRFVNGGFRLARTP